MLIVFFFVCQLVSSLLTLKRRFRTTLQYRCPLAIPPIPGTPEFGVNVLILKTSIQKEFLIACWYRKNEGITPGAFALMDASDSSQDELGASVICNDLVPEVVLKI